MLIFPVVFVVLYNGRSIFLSQETIQSFGVCLQINCVVTKDPCRDSLFFFSWDSLVLDWDS